MTKEHIQKSDSIAQVFARSMDVLKSRPPRNEHTSATHGLYAVPKFVLPSLPPRFSDQSDVHVFVEDKRKVFNAASIAVMFEADDTDGIRKKAGFAVTHHGDDPSHIPAQVAPFYIMDAGIEKWGEVLTDFHLHTNLGKWVEVKNPDYTPEDVLDITRGGDLMMLLTKMVSFWSSDVDDLLKTPDRE